MKYFISRAIPFLLAIASLSTTLLGQIVPGSMAGSPDVTASGAFTYSVPLKLPPGVKDMVPELAICYNSQGGNGSLGMGWNISGLSCVSRVPSDIYHNLGVHPVNLNAGDYFAIDGKKLKATGPGTYVSTTADFSVITSSGTVGTGPASFQVETQDGLIYEYGNTIDSRMLASGSAEVLMWGLNKLRDRNGNSVNYHYQSTPSAGVYQIDQITYAGNSPSGAAYGEVDFTYEPRGDNQIRYLYGITLQQTERLKTIIVKYAGTTIHTYTLLYSEDVYSHLIKITEAGQTGVELPSTEFIYGGSALLLAEESGTTMSSDPTLPADFRHNITAGDFNGDGYTDIVGVSQGHWPVTGDFRMNLNNKYDDFSTLTPTGPIPMEPFQVYGGVKATLDFNGDGKTDMLTVTYNGLATSGYYVAYIHLANGTGFNTPIPIYSNGGGTDKFQNVLITVGSFLGNGRQQVLLAFPDNPPIVGVPSSSVLYQLHLIGDGGFNGFTPFTTLSGHRCEFQAMDFDGDGKDELFTSFYTVMPPFMTTKIYAFTTAFDPATKLPIIGSTVMSNTVGMSYPTMYHRVYYGDFNGDGMADVLTWEPSATQPWEIGYSTGNNITKINVSDPGDAPRYLGLSIADPGLTVPLTGVPPTLTDDHNIRIADFNGDGKSDILEIFSSSGTGPPYIFKVYYSKGDQTFTAESHTLTAPIANIEDHSISVGDFNGDGQADVLLHPDGDYIRFLYFRKNESRHLIKQITNNNNYLAPNGEKITVTYLPLPNDNFYLPCSSPPTYPCVETISGRIKLVKTLENNRLPVSNSYYYKGSVVHATGLGFRGFERFHVINSATSRTILQTFEQQLYERVVPVEVSVNTTAPPIGGSPVVYVFGTFPVISRKQYAYSETTLPSGVGLVYPNSELTEDFASNLRTLTTYDYSASTTSLQDYGKPDKITTEIGYGTEVSEQEFTYNTGAVQFFNRDNPAAITTKNTRAGSPVYSRTTNYNYDALGRVSSVKSDPGTPHENILSYVYDAWGNATSETSTVTPFGPVTNIYSFSADHRFVTQHTNVAGHTESWTHDPWGNVLTSTNINGVVETSTYDDFCRLTTVVNSASPGITQSLAYHWANSPSPTVTGCPPGVLSLAIKTSTSGISGSSWKFYDYSGNVVRAIHPGFNGTDIYNDADYFPDGSISSESLPYYLGDPVLTKNHIYDNFGRKYSTTTPTSGITTYSCTPNIFSPTDPFGGTTVESNNPLTSKTVRTTMDATGKTTEIDDCGISSLKNEYHSNGNLSYTSANGAPTTYDYDSYGNLIQKIAPNSGTATMTYDAKNRLKAKMDGAGITFTYGYDDLNRMTSKTGPGVSFIYNYDGGGMSSYGNLTSATGPIPTTSANYLYDAFSRLAVKIESISGSIFTTGYSYDAYSRPFQTTYPGGNTIRNEYNAYGYLNGILAVGLGGYPPMMPDMPIWRKNAENVFGQTTDVDMGYDPSVILSASTLLSVSSLPMLYGQTHNYNTHSFLTDAKLFTSGGTLIHNGYSFNEATGNLLSISDMVTPKSETFGYDILDRLTSASQSGGTITGGSQTFTYAANGNMKRKSDISTSDWRYVDYAVKEIPNPITTAIPSFTQTDTYTPYDKVETLSENGKSVSFAYHTNEQRGKATYYSGPSLIKTRYYAENYEKTVTIGSPDKSICYVMAEGVPVAMLINNGGGPTIIKYLGTDHLGSIVKVLNSTGGLDEDRSYDAWGRMRNPYDWTYNLTTVASYPYQYDRGYTAQELLGDFNVLNLNGRLYDPMIGRMFSVDPYITIPSDPQTYNSYSYANNNPLKYTDKGGEWALVDDLAAMAIGGVSNVISQGLSGGIHSWGDGVAYFAIGAASGEATLYGGPVLGGAVMSGGNSIWGQASNNGKVSFNNVNWDKAAGAAVFGGLTSYGSAAIGGTIGSLTNRLFDNISSPVLRGALKGAVDNAANSFVIGTVIAGSSGASLDDAISEGMSAALTGGGIGLTTGGIAGYQYARKHDINPWNGHFKKTQINSLPYADLVKSAQEQYPNKAGKIEYHHIDPKYMGGDINGPTVPLDASYHQVITNEFRSYHGYGKGTLNETDRTIIMNKVYSKYPIPGYKP
jgi:RHS repeat-associated protein